MKLKVLNFASVGQCCLICAAALILSGCESLLETDREITLDQLPAHIRERVLQETMGGSIEEIERERELWHITYEVEYRVDDVEWELEINHEGEVLSRETD